MASPLRACVFGQFFTFASVKEVLCKSSDLRSGDVQAGLAAQSDRERVAAKRVLSELTLDDLYESPSVPYEIDELTRLFQDSCDKSARRRMANKSLGEVREWILSANTSGRDLLAISPGLTPEMVGALARLMSNMDLIAAAKKIRVVVRCNNTLGLEGRISSRLQPNHPRDAIEGILAVMLEGLSYGNGDAVIGINPSTETVESTIEILKRTRDLMNHLQVPTQNCVLSHVTVQMEALRMGAPLDLCFQSIAGSEGANKNFGVNIALLDEAYAMTRELGSAQGPNVMYFETGQGTALSANAHHGTDQVTMEARAYGLARRYAPFIVNSVVGFIGPEYLHDAKQITRAGLEDHFMGKLSGLSMGCDACYTNHAECDQNDLENLELLLATAGVNYLMGIPAGDDVMLNYETTSFHNNATLREVLGLRPAPEFESWLERVGLWRDGHMTDRAGDPSVFLRRESTRESLFEGSPTRAPRSA
ncbi:MAG: ethanolamine ammonia-lyase subunit EutB [Deltaproteobacteria bacterium]|nr:ethanolamine ammonia-lyase subunit EutB [Deltaproteobacteria bacterium]